MLLDQGHQPQLPATPTPAPATSQSGPSVKSARVLSIQGFFDKALLFTLLCAGFFTLPSAFFPRPKKRW